MKPRLLDLFCGAGGAAKGYQRAGFHVTGVDINPQPNYCGDEFVRDDATFLMSTYPWWDVEPFDAIHASPPCQALTTTSNRWRGQGGEADSHVNLIPWTRERLERTGLPYVIENVPGARQHMNANLLLHGGQFWLGVYRPRLFETNFMVLAPKAATPAKTIGVYGKSPDGRRLNNHTEQRAASSVEEARAAMGIDWMDWRELCEAIPPDYTEHIGLQLMQVLRHKAYAA